MNIRDILVYQAKVTLVKTQSTVFEVTKVTFAYFTLINKH